MARFECNMISYVLQRAVDVTVIIPSVTIPEALAWTEKHPSHRVRDAYPVMYLLHGMGNNHATWCGYSNVELFAEERNIAVVMLSGENKSYRSVPGGDDYDRFLEEELPEFITSMFPISILPEQTYIAGLSMGGAGALVHGIGNLGKYAAIGAFSAAILGESEDGEADENKWKQRVPRERIIQARERKECCPKIYLACGEKDSLYQENLKLAEFLKAENVDVTWVPAAGYGHEWRFWNQQVESFMDWLPRTDEYAKRGKRKV